MIEIPSLDPVVVRWSAVEDARAGRPLLVLLHGYGADENDLFGLAAYLPDEFVFAAVRAPLAPPFPTPGYSWYAIDGLGSRDPAPVTAATERFLEWLDEVTAAVQPTAVGLLGFSQGGAIAIQAMRLRPAAFAFAVNLSGFVVPGDLPGDADLAETRPPVFWGRGNRDDVIPEFLVVHTTDWLPAHSTLSGRVYPGLTHSVSEPELHDIRAFLQRQLDALRGGTDPSTSSGTGPTGSGTGPTSSATGPTSSGIGPTGSGTGPTGSATGPARSGAGPTGSGTGA